MTFEWLVALRYLRSPNRPAVLRLVTLLAVMGVAAGVTTLVIALSMNTGFRQAIRDRLLSVTAHVNLKPIGPEGIRDYRGTDCEAERARRRAIDRAGDLQHRALSFGGHARGVVLKGVDPELELQASGALRHIVAGSDDFAPDADGIPALMVGRILAERLGDFRGRLRDTDEPAGQSDAVRNAAAVAAISRGRNFRFGILRLRRELGIRDAAFGAGDWPGWATWSACSKCA